jgi:CheY-like chemotaxis protein
VKHRNSSKLRKGNKDHTDRSMDDIEKEADFEHILELVRFVAARSRKSAVCTQQHREALKGKKEIGRRWHELDRWHESAAFTPREKAAMSLSESISLKQSRELTEAALNHARRHFGIGEIISLSLAIMAINDWLDLHAEPYLRVLVVEDDPNDQELLRHQLRRTQMEENVMFMSDAAQALVLLEGCRDKLFDWELIAIFIDLQLPGMNGIELLRRIRSLPEIGELPVIVITHSTNPEDIEECRRLKVESYVQKPVTFTSFSKSIANIFHPGKAPSDRLQHVVE